MADLKKYDNKEYDFDIAKQDILNRDTFNAWTSLYNLSDTRKEKIWLATLDLLEQMSKDPNSYAGINSIYFSPGFAEEKGRYGRKVENSKHYRNATAYILSRFALGTPYTPAEPEKTDISLKILGDRVLNGLGVTDDLDDVLKMKVSETAFNDTLNWLNGLQEGTYNILDEGRDLEYYKKLLGEGITASKSPDTFRDDAAIWGQLGLRNPFRITLPLDTTGYSENLQAYLLALELFEKAKKLNPNLDLSTWLLLGNYPWLDLLRTKNIQLEEDTEGAKIPNEKVIVPADELGNNLLKNRLLHVLGDKHGEPLSGLTDADIKNGILNYLTNLDINSAIFIGDILDNVNNSPDGNVKTEALKLLKRNGISAYQLSGKIFFKLDDSENNDGAIMYDPVNRLFVLTPKNKYIALNTINLGEVLSSKNGGILTLKYLKLYG